MGVVTEYNFRVAIVQIMKAWIKHGRKKAMNQLQRKRRCVAAARDRTFQGLCGAPGNKGPFLSPWKGLVERVWQFQGRKSQGRYFARKKMVRRRSVRTRRQKSVDFVVLFSEDVVQFSTVSKIATVENSRDLQQIRKRKGWDGVFTLKETCQVS